MPFKIKKMDVSLEIKVAALTELVKDLNTKVENHIDTIEQLLLLHRDNVLIIANLSSRLEKLEKGKLLKIVPGCRN